MYLIIYLSFLGLKQTSQSITADGSTTTAVDVTSAVTEINATSATHTCAMADGSDGQIKIIINTSTSGTNAITITPANLRGYTSSRSKRPGEQCNVYLKIQIGI